MIFKVTLKKRLFQGAGFSMNDSTTILRILITGKKRSIENGWTGPHV